jgi:hypothetical protein
VLGLREAIGEEQDAIAFEEGEEGEEGVGRTNRTTLLEHRVVGLAGFWTLTRDTARGQADTRIERGVLENIASNGNRVVGKR